MANKVGALFNSLCTLSAWALATYFPEKWIENWASQERSWPASETSADTKAGGRGMARAGEGAGLSALLWLLALQPLWGQNHGHNVVTSCSSFTVPSFTSCLLSISSSLIFSHASSAVSWPETDVWLEMRHYSSSWVIFQLHQSPLLCSCAAVRTTPAICRIKINQILEHYMQKQNICWLLECSFAHSKHNSCYVL